MLNEYAQEFLKDEGCPDDLVLDPEYVNFRYWDWDRDIRKPTQLRFKNIDRRGFDAWLAESPPNNCRGGAAHLPRRLAQDDAIVICHAAQRRGSVRGDRATT